MRARDLAAPFPRPLETTRSRRPVLAGQRLPGLIVFDAQGRPYTILAGTQVLRIVIPHYIQDDPALAGSSTSRPRTSSCRELGGPHGRRPAAPAADPRAAGRRRRRHRPGDRRGDGPHAQPARRRRRRRAGVLGAVTVSRLLEHCCPSVTGSVLVVAVFVVAYVLIATERINRVAAALAGPPAWCSSASSTPTTRSSPRAPASTGTSSSCCSG